MSYSATVAVVTVHNKMTYLPYCQPWGGELGKETVENGGVKVHQESALPAHTHTHTQVSISLLMSETI